MTKVDILYEVGEVSDGGELAKRFLERFLEDVDGLDHSIENVDNDMKDWSVSVTIDTRARVTETWFSNADTVVVG